MQTFETPSVNGHSAPGAGREVFGRIRIEQPLAAVLRATLPTHAVLFDRHYRATALVYRSAAECEALRLWLYALIGQLEQLRDHLQEVAS
jgi:hypothetical protein